jgi:hypothetical protein
MMLAIERTVNYFLCVHQLSPLNVIGREGIPAMSER